nr:FdtA/QdtA family cupin domain-containing protein [uncultured Mediterraneibacter sp.]
MVSNTRLIEFKDIKNTESRDGYMGHLVPIEAESDIPFAINRIYYIADVPEGQVRGFHSHNDLEQVLICLHGSVTVKISTPFEEEHIVLDRLNKGLYIGPMVWREMYDFSQDAVLLVLASKHYDEADYIRDYPAYCRQAEGYFKGGE